jgi:Holliday junction resolvase
MSRGITRERQLRTFLENEDWFVTRAAGSLGEADLVALKAGETPRLIEVKSDRAGPYANFRPRDRDGLRLAARLAGADAWLCWWPPRAQMHWIPEKEWPT